MQQINLYLPEFQPNRAPLRSIHMLWGGIAFIGLLLLFSWIIANKNNEWELLLDSKREQLDQHKASLLQLEQQRPNSSVAELDAEIIRLKEGLQRREQILNIIANKKLGNNTGYSGYLQALGTQSLTTISLQAFSLQQGGSYVEFAGQTRAADQVPLYIQRLRTQAVFAQSAFGVLHIAPAESGLFDFSLAKENSRSDNNSGKTAVQVLLELNEKTSDSAKRGRN